MKEAQALEKKKKFFLLLPVFCVPFLVLMFWLMGGGKTVPVTAAEQSGLNASLPHSDQGKEGNNTKLDYYNEAERDSMRWYELVKSDPNYAIEGDELLDSTDEYGLNTSLHFSSGNKSSEERIYERLEQLDRELNRPVEYEDDYGSSPPTYRGSNSYNYTHSAQQDLERLEQMMERMNAPAEEDQEMKQLNEMMDKILDIQHPERIQQKSDAYAEKQNGQVFAVRPQSREVSISLMDNKSAAEYADEYNVHPEKRPNRFFGLDDAVTADSYSENVIEAVVHQDQTITSGSVVKLRLLRDITVNGLFIPKDEFVNGVASLRGERLEVDIESIRYGNSIFPVKLSVYDMDGLTGIYIPGAITRDVVKQNGDQAIQSMNLLGFNQSLGAQAASAGIELGKNLFSRKVRLVKVNLKAGYKVFLKDNKRKEQ